MKLKNLLATIWTFIAKLWKSVDTLIEKITPIAVNIVNEIKKINESTTGDIVEMILSAAIPGTADDKIITLIRSRLKTILPKIILSLNISESIAKIEDPNEQLKAIITAINLSPNKAKNVYYHGLCTMIVDAVSDGKVTWSESILISEYYFKNIYNK
jgi:hypothetical protein